MREIGSVVIGLFHLLPKYPGADPLLQICAFPLARPRCSMGYTTAFPSGRGFSTIGLGDRRLVYRLSSSGLPIPYLHANPGRERGNASR